MKEYLKRALISLCVREKKVLELRFGLNDGTPRTLEVDKIQPSQFYIDEDKVNTLKGFIKNSKVKIGSFS